MAKNSELVKQVDKVKEERALTKTAKQEVSLPEALDWKKWSLPMTAKLLSRIPMPSRDGDLYLTPEQAAIWAIVSFEQNLSPFTGETWFNPQNNKVNLTLQGKLSRARNLGLNLGAPQFVRVENEESGDIGYRCILPTSNGNVEYLAWKSEWAMPSNPNWKNRPEHMLQVRAYEKAVSFAAGVGASEDPGDRDIETSAGEPVPQNIPSGNIDPVEAEPVDNKEEKQ